MSDYTSNINTKGPGGIYSATGPITNSSKELTIPQQIDILVAKIKSETNITINLDNLNLNERSPEELVKILTGLKQLQAELKRYPPDTKNDLPKNIILYHDPDSSEGGRNDNDPASTNIHLNIKYKEDFNAGTFHHEIMHYLINRDPYYANDPRTKHKEFAKETNSEHESFQFIKAELTPENAVFILKELGLKPGPDAVEQLNAHIDNIENDKDAQKTILNFYETVKAKYGLNEGQKSKINSFHEKVNKGDLGEQKLNIIKLHYLLIKNIGLQKNKIAADLPMYISDYARESREEDLCETVGRFVFTGWDPKKMENKEFRKKVELIVGFEYDPVNKNFKNKPVKPALYFSKWYPALDHNYWNKVINPKNQ